MIKLASFTSVALAASVLMAAQQSRARAAVYVGRTPCGAIANNFTGFPSANCEKIKWELTLRRTVSGAPAGYRYRGTRSTREGQWSIRRGTARDPDAIVFQLTYDNGRVLSLLSIDEEVLVLLDDNLRVLAGDASWSNVLNKTVAK